MSSPIFNFLLSSASRFSTLLSHYVPAPVQKSVKSNFVNILTHHRWIFVVLFLIPLSILYDITWNVYSRILVFMRTFNPKLHDDKVKRIQEQVKNTPNGVKMCTSRPAYLAMSLFEGKYKKTMKNIDIDLYDILEVNEIKRTVRVEPMCTMGQITKELIPRGWTLAVTPELDDLTVGGLIMGFGVESSSHKYGLFQYICTAFEIVLPNGELVKCDKDNHPELFYNIPWSHGTLGFLVSAELKIVPATSYVELTYHPCYSKESYVELFTEVSDDTTNDFVEGLVYSPERAVIMTGKFAAKVPKDGKIQAIGLWFKPWFYQHVESFLYRKPSSTSSSTTFTEYIPLRDYYHRHTRSIFWELKEIVPFGDHPLARFILGYFMPPRISLLKLTQTSATKELYEKFHVAQDMLVPISTLEKSLNVFEKELNVFPIWLCPMAVYKTPKRGLINPTPSGETMFVDIGAYGTPHVQNFNVKKALRNVEAFVRSVKGFQALYADTYLTREEFNQMFDHSEYNKLRQKYQCDGKLPVIYDKVAKSSRG